MKSEEAQIKGPRLEKPVRITEQVWPEGTVPVVSVFCITYNHVNFIRDAIEGFLMQETTFPVEIFIHDDASTDGTAEIVREYAEKYPKLFWTVLQNENQWSRGNKKILADYSQKQRGEFIALCEGDDYWTKPHKLEKQLQFLWQHPDCVMCHHLVDYWSLKEKTVIRQHPDPPYRKPKIPGIEFSQTNLIQTCSAVYRAKLARDRPAEFGRLKIGDWPLFAWLGQYGQIGYIDEVMAVFNYHEGSYWSHAPREFKGQVLQQMAEVLAATLNLKHAWPWFQKAIAPEASRMYKAAFAGAPIETMREGLKVFWKAYRNRRVSAVPALVQVLKAILVSMKKRLFHSMASKSAPPRK